MVRRLFLQMKFSESVALLRGWVEIMVTKTLEFMEMKIYSPLSVEKIEERSTISSRNTSHVF